MRSHDVSISGIYVGGSEYIGVRDKKKGGGITSSKIMQEVQRPLELQNHRYYWHRAPSSGRLFLHPSLEVGRYRKF